MRLKYYNFKKKCLKVNFYDMDIFLSETSKILENTNASEKRECYVKLFILISSKNQRDSWKISKGIIKYDMIPHFLRELQDCSDNTQKVLEIIFNMTADTDDSISNFLIRNEVLDLILTNIPNWKNEMLEDAMEIIGNMCIGSAEVISAATIEEMVRTVINVIMSKENMTEIFRSNWIWTLGCLCHISSLKDREKKEILLAISNVMENFTIDREAIKNLVVGFGYIIMKEKKCEKKRELLQISKNCKLLDHMLKVLECDISDVSITTSLLYTISDITCDFSYDFTIENTDSFFNILASIFKEPHHTDVWKGLFMIMSNIFGENDEIDSITRKNLKKFNDTQITIIILDELYCSLDKYLYESQEWIECAHFFVNILAESNLEDLNTMILTCYGRLLRVCPEATDKVLEGIDILLAKNKRQKEMYIKKIYEIGGLYQNLFQLNSELYPILKDILGYLTIKTPGCVEEEKRCYGCKTNPDCVLCTVFWKKPRDCYCMDVEYESTNFELCMQCIKRHDLEDCLTITFEERVDFLFEFYA